MKALAFVYLVCLSIAAARADLTASLSPSIQNSAVGQRLVFSGSLTNTGTSNLYLNSIAYTLPGGLTSGSNAFYANVPGILSAGQSYTGQLFGVALDSTATPADYNGSVAIQGGDNIFATTILASPSFTILSPAVSIVATSATASEFGPVPGVFTISRTGGTGIPLPVSFTIGGSGLNGSDYQAITASAVIAAGSSSVAIAITPILQDVAFGSRTVSLSIPSSTLINSSAPVAATVTIQDTPFNAWRLQTFGASANSPQSYPTAEWAQAGIPNLIAFALNINPQAPAESLLPSVALASNYATLTYVPNPAATDVTYSVEASTDLINWSAVNVQSATTEIPNAVASRYNNPVSTSNPVIFLRLVVTPLDWQ